MGQIKFQIHSHIHSLSIPGRRNWAYFHCLGTGQRFRDDRWFSKLPFSPWKLATGQKTRNGTYTLSNPGGQNWDHSRSTGSGFQDTGRFSKFSYMGINFRSCIYTLFLPQGVEIELIVALWAAVSEVQANFQKLPYLGMKLGKWPKFQKLHIYPLSTPGGRNWGYFLLYGQRFPRYGPSFKIPIFGHETWQVASGQSSRSCTYTLFLPQGWTLNLFLLYGQRFPR